MRDLATLFKALADETRLAIVFLIVEHGELCVCDIERTLDISQSKASRHLRYLYNSGLLHDRREGVWVYYRVRDDLEPALAEILKKLRALISGDDAQRLRDQLAEWLERKASEGPPCV
jgi:ArsR family transcriptional regulator